MVSTIPQFPKLFIVVFGTIDTKILAPQVEFESTTFWLTAKRSAN